MIAVAEQNGTTFTFRDDSSYPTITVENATGEGTFQIETQSKDFAAVVRIQENASVKALVFDVNGVQVYPAP